MRRWIVVFAVVLIVALAGGAAALYAYDASRSDMIAKGVTAAGVDVGGLHARDARSTLRRALVPGLNRPLLVGRGGKVVVLTPTQAHLDLDLDGMVDRAVAQSRRGNVATRITRELRGDPVHAAIPLRVTYAEEAVQATVRRVAKRFDRPARNAAVTPHPDWLQIVRSKPGIAVRRWALAIAIRRQLQEPDSPHVVHVSTLVVEPKISTAKLAKKYPAYIRISRPTFRLFFYKHLHLYKTYRIAVGRAGLETPAGLYAVNDKQVNPSWHVPNSAWAGDLAGKIIPPGPDDPIKARWLGIYAGAGIHGTDDVGSLGTAASHGCIRMSIPDVIELFDMVPMGTPVFIA